MTFKAFQLAAILGAAAPGAETSARRNSAGPLNDMISQTVAWSRALATVRNTD